MPRTRPVSMTLLVTSLGSVPMAVERAIGNKMGSIHETE